MGWCAKGFLPEFPELIKNIGADKAEKLLKTLALTKKSLGGLGSISSSGDYVAPRRKFLALIHSTSTRHLPLPL